MLKTNLKIAWRSIKKDKAFSAINIGGLALGMAVVIMIGLWEYGYRIINIEWKFLGGFLALPF